MTGGAELYARTRDFVQGMAYYYGHQGANPSQAVAQAGPDDIVLVAGKGHEPYQEIHGVKHPFDDTAVARHALEDRR